MKSGPIMAFRLQLYNYFEQNEERILHLTKRNFDERRMLKNKVISNYNIYKIRLYFCMMFYAFEIKSDMA